MGQGQERDGVLVGGWVTPEEKEDVIALAQQVHLSTSELVRRLVTGRKLPDAARHKAVIALGKINADLARLGNLILMTMNDADFTPPEGVDLQALLDDVRDTQSVLKAKVMEL